MNNDWATGRDWNNPTYRDMDRYMTLEQVSIELGVSWEQARQIEQAALRKARRILEKRGFNLDDLFH